ncbi:MAG: hypothetical protein COB85_01970 [Bacteroidetes bacterium]|nr:MAG: hypothetical protein COB85_01970 [Bacteroidota bacterium]
MNDVPAGVPTISISVDVSCFGGNDGLATVSMAGGTLPFTYLWDGGQTTSSATGLIAGVYNVDVTDSNGCLVTTAAVITEPTVLTASTVSDSVSCNGLCDGTATVSIAGGTSPYSPLWSDPLAQTSTTAVGLCAGSYNVTVTDDKGCTIIITENVNEPSPIVLTENHTDANCGQSDGTAEVVATGGSGGYTYSWSNLATTSSIINVSANTYIATVTDNNGCTETISSTVSDLSGPIAVISNSDSVSCFEGTNGFATVTVTGGTLPYAYVWDDSLNQTTQTGVNLSAGIYTVLATDSNGCNASATVTIYEPNALVFNPASTDPTCFGDCDGSVGVTVAGGTSPYGYIWNDSNTQTTATASSLCSGSYNVIITDANGCVELGVVAIVDPLPLTAITSFTDVLCFGDENGTASVFPSNGSGAYTYLWDDDLNQGTPTAGSLATGTYNVTVYDENGCFTTSQATVGTPTLLVTAVSVTGDVDCNGNCNGYIQSTTSGGTPQYTYSWDDGQNQSNAQAIALCAGSYSLLVTDQNGCEATTGAVITEPQPIVAIISHNNVSCFEYCDGDATTSVSGGSLPYLYLWNDGKLQTTQTADSLCAGSYGVTVTDNEGCITTSSVVITEPQVLSLIVSSITSSTCGQNNGGACVNVIGGVSPYVITWNDPFTTVGSCIDSVYAGVYNPIVVDGNGCFKTIPVIIDDILGPVIDTVLVTDVTCAGDDNGTATVFPIGGSPPYTYNWKDNGVTIDSTNSVVFGLSGGVYTITLLDNNGCVSNSSVIVNEPPALVSAITTFDDAKCNGFCDGSATVIAGGGTTPYSYAWTTGPTTSTANGLCAGIHNVFITDANGCTDINTVTIGEPDAIVIVDSVNNISCDGGSDGSIYLEVTGGTGFYIYAWTPNVGNGNIVTNLAANTYFVNVTDQYGCLANQVSTVNEPLPVQLAIFSTQSTCGDPNGTAAAVASGGTPSYSYLWSNGSVDSMATALTAITYTVTVTDNMGCTTDGSVNITDIPGPVITNLDVDDVICFNQGNGRATVFATGGTLPYGYMWNDGQTSSTATALPPGPISVVVTDAQQCETTDGVVITQPDSLYVIVSPDVSICLGESATINATGIGGSPTYVYNWSSGFVGPGDFVVSPESTIQYIVSVSDENGCLGLEDTITVTVSPGIELSTIGNTVCEGESATFSVTVTGGNGGPYTYLWSNGATTSEQTIPGLTADVTYSVTVSDGCSPDSVATVDIIVNPPPIAGFMFSGGGCAPVIGSFIDTSIVNIDEWSWDFGDPASGSDNFASGPVVNHTYNDEGVYDVTLIVKNVEGCYDTIVQVAAINVNGMPVAYFTPNPDVATLLNSTILFVDSSYSNITSWSWDFGDPISGSDNYDTTQNPLHTYNEIGVYYITLSVGTDSCAATYMDSVEIKGDYIIFVPSAFTPNGDPKSKNEYFKPLGVGISDENFEFYIYDRWGDQIYHYKGPYTTWIGWDGRANNGDDIAQQDVYVWLIKTQDIDGEDHEYIGHVTLIR